MATRIPLISSNKRSALRSLLIKSMIMFFNWECKTEDLVGGRQYLVMISQFCETDWI